MKILIANIGSTSLKWRLFDFSNSAEKLLHKGGFERVTDYPKAIEDCLAQLKEAEPAMQAVRTALAEHGVLFVRDQHLSPDEQVALTRRFGDVLRVPYIQHLADHPDVIAVLKEADERRISTFGGTWHSDFSFLDEPPSLTLLHAIELPAVGGDTLWSCQYAAYEALSPGMQALLDPLHAGGGVEFNPAGVLSAFHQ